MIAERDLVYQEQMPKSGREVHYVLFLRFPFFVLELMGTKYSEVFHFESIVCSGIFLIVNVF